MSQVIVYQEESAPAAVVIPSPGFDLDEVGRRSVPAGQPFWIIEAESLPADRTFRDAWELDTGSLGQPSGVGEALQ